MTITQIRSKLPQLRIQILLERIRISRISRLRISTLRHQTILVHQISEHMPPTTIISRTIINRLEHTTIQRLIQRDKHILQKHVRLLHRIPEKQVGFRKLEILQIPTMHQLITQRIKRRKHPTTPRTTLIGDTPLLQLDGEIILQHALALIVGGCGEHTG